MDEFKGIVTGCHTFRHNHRYIVIDVDGKETGWQFVCPLKGIMTDDSSLPTIGQITDMVADYHTVNAVVTGIDKTNTVGGYTPCTTISLSTLE